MRSSVWAWASASCLVLAAACHDDFQGLFGDAGGGIVDAATDDAGSTDASASCSDAGPRPPPSACVSTGCDGSTCDYACEGCGCACGGNCLAAPVDASSCTSTFGPDTKSTVTCDHVPVCSAACNGCTGTFTCNKNTSRCDVVAENAADLIVTCHSPECALTCAAGARCLLACDGEPCNLQCTGSTVVACPQAHHYACNRPCM